MKFSNWILLGFCACSLCCLFPSCPAWADAVRAGIDPDLKLHFTFDDNLDPGRILDATGLGHDGWQLNATNRVSSTNGVFGSRAAQFTPVGEMTNDWPHVYKLSQYISVTNVTGIEYLTNATVSLWARFDPNGDLGMVLLDAGYPVAYSGVSAQICSNGWTLGRDSTAYLTWIIYPSDVAQRRVVSWPNDTVGGNLCTTNFHLYTLTVDCFLDRAIAYYDGQPFRTNSIGLPWVRIYGNPAIGPWLCVGALAHNGTPQWGDDNFPNSGYMQGALDDLLIYNRTLSALEVESLFLGSGSQAFSRHVAVRRTSDNAVELAWDTQTNALYQIEFSADLDSDSWKPLRTPMVGTGQTDSLLDPILNESKRFYRVHPLP